MRVLVPIGAIVIVAVVVFIAVPQVTVQVSGSATLAAINGGAVKGTATLTPFQGAQYAIIQVNVQQLAADSVYGLALRAGSCFGGLVAQLQSVTTDETGAGTSGTTISGQISPSWFIVLYAGANINGVALACGQVVVSETAVGTPVVIPDTTPIIIIITPTNTPGGPTPTPNVPSQLPNTGGGPPK